MRLKFAIVLFLLTVIKTNATHIVGGDFYYKFKGGNIYEITLKLYIDCYNGNKEAIASDETGIISIYDGSTYKSLQQLEITRTGPIHLFGTAYKCVNMPGDVCVDQYNYTFDVELPKRKGGYIIAYERCCRNNSINNLYDPGGTGATYWVQIPDRSLVDVDNSPIFKKFPPIFICKDFPFVFDHSATDADGDSLSYMLYHPYLGADKASPAPGKQGQVDPHPPPFKNVYWQSGYSTADMMHGNPILQIDELSGELSVTPSEKGQFVCGVKVQEWRKINNQWILIGETLRDYQFNVIDCDAVAVANFKPTIWCSDTVFFTDKSIGATRVSWEFGDPASGFDNNASQLRNPVHVFSKGGDFYVKQTAWNTACNDEYTLKVKVRVKKGFDIGKDRMYCSSFKQTLYVPWNDFNSIEWSTGDKTATILVQKAGTYWVKAVYGDCVIRDTIKIGSEPVNFTGPRDSLFCEKVDAIVEFKNLSPGTKILWLNLADTGTRVRITKEGRFIAHLYNKYCSKSDSVNLVLAKITPNLGPDLFICNNFLRTLDAGAQPAGTTYKWQDSSTSRTYTTDRPGKYWVKTQLKHCSKFDEMGIENSKVIVDLGADLHFCDSVHFLADAGPANNNQPTQYQWNNGDQSQTCLIRTPGKHWVTKSDSFGCLNSDTVVMSMTYSPMIDIGKDTTICLRSPIRLTTGGNFNSYLWQDGLNQRERFVEHAGVYSVVVVDEAGCKGYDTITVKTDPNKLPNILYIPNAFTPNGDGLNDVFPFEMPVVYNQYNLKVFTRWGEKIYDSDTTHKPWDGTNLSNPDQLDAYIWMVSYMACDGKRKTDKGTITIIR